MTNSFKRGGSENRYDTRTPGKVNDEHIKNLERKPNRFMFNTRTCAECGQPRSTLYGRCVGSVGKVGNTFYCRDCATRRGL